MNKSFTLSLVACFLSTVVFGQINIENKGLSGSNFQRISINQHRLDHGDLVTDRPTAFTWQHTSQPAIVKSRTGIKQKLDYEIAEDFNAVTSTWSGTMKYGYTYDNQGNVIEETYYNPDQATGGWLLDGKTTKTYDQEGNLITSLGYSWNAETGQWEQGGKTESTYDSNANPQTKVFYYWDDEALAWIPTSKTDYTCDVTGNMLQIVYLEWDPVTGTWMPNSKSERSYDETGKRTSQNTYTWVAETGQWVNRNQYEYSYDAEGYIILETAWRWDKSGLTWLLNSKNEYSYNDTHELILYTYSNWSLLSETWIGFTREEHQYDSYGNQTQDLNYSWNSETGQWISDNKVVYDFDFAYSSNELFMPEWLRYYGAFTNKIISYSFFDWDDALSDWIPLDRSTFVYSDIGGSGISEDLLPMVRVFPNPATEQIMIKSGQPLESATIELFDVQGRKVLSQILSGSNRQVSVGELNSGLYYYRVTQGPNVDSGKLMIR